MSAIVTGRVYFVPSSEKADGYEVRWIGEPTTDFVDKGSEFITEVLPNILTLPAVKKYMSKTGWDFRRIPRGEPPFVVPDKEGKL